MHADQIEKLKALALAATPGPWVPGGTTITTHKGCNGSWWELCSIMMSPEGKRPHWQAGFVRDQSNADYIAAANPAAVLELIAEVERYRWIRKVENGNAAWDMLGSGLGGSNLDAAIDAAIGAHAKAGTEPLAELNHASTRLRAEGSSA